MSEYPNSSQRRRREKCKDSPLCATHTGRRTTDDEDTDVRHETRVQGVLGSRGAAHVRQGVEQVRDTRATTTTTRTSIIQPFIIIGAAAAARTQPVHSARRRFYLFYRRRTRRDDAMMRSEDACDECNRLTDATMHDVRTTREQRGRTREE